MGFLAEILTPLLTIVFVCVFVFSGVRRSRNIVNNGKGSNSGNIVKNSGNTGNGMPVVPVAPKPVKKHKKDSGIALMEDKSHDWLAQQIAYEKSMKQKVDDMFLLRKEHAGACEADKIKETHAKRCDADRIKDMHAKNCDVSGIDTGQY